MPENPNNIPVEVVVNEDTKTAIVRIPSTLLATVDGEGFRQWLLRPAKVRADWEADGYRCN